MSGPDKFDPRKVIFTPGQAATAGLQAIKRTAESTRHSTGIALPIDGIGLGPNPYFPPVMPGQVCVILAQTSNYKTGMMQFIESYAASELEKAGARDHILIHISVEELVEEQALSELARYAPGEDAGRLARGSVQDWTRLEAAAVRVGAIPIYRIGDSLARAEDMPHLNVSNMLASVEALVGEGILGFRPTVAGMFFDYLQAFPLDNNFKQANPDTQRRLQVRHDFYQIRYAASRYACPCFVAVQAKQHLDGASPPIYLPGMYDAEETSSIAQRTDRMFSLWMPKSHFRIGEHKRKGSFGFTVTENLLFIKVLKQKPHLPSGKVWLTNIDYATGAVRVLPQGGAHGDADVEDERDREEDDQDE